jgi:DNA-binding winged helix-turn-helix (wHTH) protein/tetratricopeptide (TPR) repeat protein
MTRARALRFGPFQVDPKSGEISENGSRIKLQGQPFEVLVALLEHPGEVVTREELRQRLWSGDTFVDFDNSVNIAVRKLRQTLNDNALNPRYIETLAKRGYRFIGTVDREDADLQAGTQGTSAPAGSRRRVLVAAGLVCAALISAAFLILSRREGRASALVRVRPAVAILGFRNLAARSDSAWVSTALAEMITSELSSTEQLRTVATETVAREKVALALPEVETYGRPTLERIRKNLGADFVITGSYFDMGRGSPLRLDLRLQDARDGEVLWAGTENGSESDLPALVAHAGQDLRSKLGVAAAVQATAPAHFGTASADALRLYAEGLARLRQFDALGARDLLERAVATAPDSAPAHSALAAAWSALGYAELAKKEALKARDLANGLPRGERLSIEARYLESVGQWDQALSVYRRLGELFPDDLDYGLRLAAAQVKAGRGKDALATVELLRRNPPPIRDDAAIDYAQSLAANETGDFQRAQAAADRSATQAAARGESMLVADARLLECRELEALGRMAEAKRSCETARGLYASAGDRAGAASATGYAAAALDGAGERAAAEKLYQAALSIQRDIGNQGGALWDVNGLAQERLFWGDYLAARELYKEALRTARDISSRSDAADALANIGFTWLLEGELAEAQRSLEEALSEFRAMGNLSGVGNTLNNLGETLYYQGQLSEAARSLEEALEADRRTGEKGEMADALAWSGVVQMASGDAAGARRFIENSLRTWGEMGEGYGARTRLVLAELELDSGNSASAESQVKECLTAKSSLPAANVLMARVLLTEGKLTEARSQIQLAAPLATSSQSRVQRLAFAVAAAPITGRTDPGAAIKQLEAAESEAVAHGFIGWRFEAQLALGEIEMNAGRRAAGLSRLRKLENDARAKGFNALSEKARRTIARPV